MADLKISQFANGGDVQPTDEIATNRGGINTKVFVGLAASYDAGTDIGELLVIDDVGGQPALPPMDGSQLTDLNIDFTSAYTLTTKTTAGDVTTVGESVVLVNKTVGAATLVTWNHAAKEKLIVKDAKGDATTNNITVELDSGLIDGGANIVLNSNSSSVTLISDGTNAWII